MMDDLYICVSDKKTISFAHGFPSMDKHRSGKGKLERNLLKDSPFLPLKARRFFIRAPLTISTFPVEKTNITLRVLFVQVTRTPL